MAAYSSEKIAKRVAEARSDGWKKLDLFGYRVKSNDVRALLAEPGVEQLQELHLGRNRLCTLPPEIGRLILLTKLDLSGNRISKLPSEFGRLTALTRLGLGGNRFLGLPPEILHLTDLEELVLSREYLV